MTDPKKRLLRLMLKAKAKMKEEQAKAAGDTEVKDSASSTE
jgi:hypothetical protein